MSVIFPNTIMHCDADAFFVGCEMARNPALKEKPVVVLGYPGGIVLSKSFDLKKKGVKTGMPIWEAKKICPSLIALPADSAWYQQCSENMMKVLNHWSPSVEVYSIDEAFVDFFGLQKLYGVGFEKTAFSIKEEIKKKFGFTVSIGISVNKILAKMASEMNKPDGVTVISKKEIPFRIFPCSIQDVPGIGKKSATALSRYGIVTCADFIRLSEDVVRRLLHRPGVDLWKELKGEKIFPVKSEPVLQKSIRRTRSFSPLSSDPKFLWSHTVMLLEKAQKTLLDQRQLAGILGLYFRDKDFRKSQFFYRFGAAVNSFSELLDGLRMLWKMNIPKSTVFRSTGIILADLVSDQGAQMSLFESSSVFFRKQRLEAVKDVIRRRFGFKAIQSANLLQTRR